MKDTIRLFWFVNDEENSQFNDLVNSYSVPSVVIMTITIQLSISNLSCRFT